MLRGDLSNVAAPRLIVVFDDTLGTLSPTGERRRRLYLRARQFHRAADCWEIEVHVLRVLTDWQYRSPYNVDIATFTDPREAAHIEERLENVGIPFGNFYNVTVEELARVHANMPHIAAIFDAGPGRSMAYGAKSRPVLAL